MSTVNKSFNNGKNINQVIALMGDNKSKVDSLLNKIDMNKEFEFKFGSLKNKMLNREKFISLLKYINYLSNVKNYEIEGPYEQLDISYSLDSETSYRITVHNVNNNLKKTLNHLINKTSNFSILKLLLIFIYTNKNKEKFTIIKKIRNRENIVDIEELNIRAKLSDEIDVFNDIVNKTGNIDELILKIINNENISLENIDNINKNIFFRYKERNTLYFVKEPKKHIKLDLTFVKFSNKLGNINNAQRDYELELEYMTNKVTQEDKNKMYSICENILKMIEKTNFIINKSMEEKVLKNYKLLMTINENSKITSLESRQPISLEIENVSSLPDKYAVTDKADGDRYFLIIIYDNVYLISNNLKVRDTGIVLSSTLGKKYNGTVLDGEFIFIPKYNSHVYMAFDCLIFNKIDIRDEDSIMKRLSKIDLLIKDCFIDKSHKGFVYKNKPTSGNKFKIDEIEKFHTSQLGLFYENLTHDLQLKNKYPIIRRKYFIDVQGAKKIEIFRYSLLFWNFYTRKNNVNFPYELDGLIYHPLQQKYTTNKSDSLYFEYKWKPVYTNSIDFYIEFKKDKITKKPLIVYDNSNYYSKNEEELTNKISYNDENFTDENNEFVKNKPYRICNLYVGKNIKGKEFPIPFEQEDICQCNLYLTDNEVRDLEGDILLDKSVVEFTYSPDESLDPKHRWIPLRTRHDKTEFIERHKRKYGNYHTIANKVWSSIINPVLMSDFNDISKDESKYFDKIQDYNSKAKKETTYNLNDENQYYLKLKNLAKDMRNFHNYIKSSIIYTHCHSNFKNNKAQSILDIGCGRGGDIHKFYMAEIDYYVGIDPDNNNLISVDGALSRYNQFKRKYPGFPKMIFIQADAKAPFSYDEQKRIVNNMTTQNKNLLQEYFSKDNKTKFDIINASFSIHYMFENNNSFNNLKTNINNHLRNNGFILITTFNGKLIRELLKGKDKYTEYYLDDDNNKQILFEIVKKFKDSDPIGTGLKIDVFNSFEASRTYSSEYIVDKEFIVDEFNNDCDLELVDFDYFKNQFEIHKDFITNYSGQKSDFATRKYLLNVQKYYNDTDFNKSCRNHTFLFCYYIFKKKNVLKKQKGGNELNSEKYDFSDNDKFLIPDMSNYDNNKSYMNSIHKIFSENKYIPQSINADKLYRNMEMSFISDNDLNNKLMKNISKSLIINHENNNKKIKVVNGLNVITVERDCNDFHDINYIQRVSKPTKNDKFIVLLKEGNLYRPLYEKKENGEKSIFNKDNDMIKYLLEYGNKI